MKQGHGIDDVIKKLTEHHIKLCDIVLDVSERMHTREEAQLLADNVVAIIASLDRAREIMLEDGRTPKKDMEVTQTSFNPSLLGKVVRYEFQDEGITRLAIVIKVDFEDIYLLHVEDMDWSTLLFDRVEPATVLQQSYRVPFAGVQLHEVQGSDAWMKVVEN